MSGTVTLAATAFSTTHILSCAPSAITFTRLANPPPPHTLRYFMAACTPRSTTDTCLVAIRTCTYAAPRIQRTTPLRQEWGWSPLLTPPVTTVLTCTCAYLIRGFFADIGYSVLITMLATLVLLLLSTPILAQAHLNAANYLIVAFALMRFTDGTDSPNDAPVGRRTP